jgi:MFS family permease
MNRNVATLLAVSVLFGASVGIYEFVLPFYLREQGISFQAMGFIFAVASAAILVARVGIGSLSDVWGRKIFYSVALAAASGSQWLTSLSSQVLGQTLLKTVRDTAFATREIMHPIVLFEESERRFLDLIGKTRGLEYLFQAGGTITAGLTIAAIGTGGNLKLAGVLAGLAFVVFAAAFRERPMPIRLAGISLREVMGLGGLPRNLKVIAASSFIFTLGLSSSHSFIMPLFFAGRFGMSQGTVAWIMFGHRLTIALPMLVVGQLPIRNYKASYILTMVIEGVAVGAAALIPGAALATGVWLLHDLIGAGIWAPIQNTIVQQYSRPEARGLDVGRVAAIGLVGAIFGPFIAGYLAQVRIWWPFLVSGALMALSAAPLAALRLEAPQPTRPTR